MGFAKKVLEYQQKKLVEAQNNLQPHLDKKEELKGMGTDKEITNEEKMIKIWFSNIEKIKRVINKLQEK